MEGAILPRSIVSAPFTLEIGYKRDTPTLVVRGGRLPPVPLYHLVRQEVLHADDDPSLPRALLLAQGLQRFRVLPVRNPRELDDHRPSPVPEVRAMSTANNTRLDRKEEAHGN